MCMMTVWGWEIICNTLTISWLYELSRSSLDVIKTWESTFFCRKLFNIQQIPWTWFHLSYIQKVFIAQKTKSKLYQRISLSWSRHINHHHYSLTNTFSSTLFIHTPASNVHPSCNAPISFVLKKITVLSMVPNFSTSSVKRKRSHPFYWIRNTKYEKTFSLQYSLSILRKNDVIFSLWLNTNSNFFQRQMTSEKKSSLFPNKD